jgi:hypothetical protein
MFDEPEAVKPSDKSRSAYDLSSTPKDQRLTSKKWAEMK